MPLEYSAQQLNDTGVCGGFNVQFSIKAYIVLQKSSRFWEKTPSCDGCSSYAEIAFYPGLVMGISYSSEGASYCGDFVLHSASEQAAIVSLADSIYYLH